MFDKTYFVIFLFLHNSNILFHTFYFMDFHFPILIHYEYNNWKLFHKVLYENSNRRLFKGWPCIQWCKVLATFFPWTIPHYKIQCTSAFEALIDFWRSAAPWRSSTEVAVPSSDWTNVSNCKIFELQIITYPEKRTQTWVAHAVTTWILSVGLY